MPDPIQKRADPQHTRTLCTLTAYPFSEYGRTRVTFTERSTYHENDRLEGTRPALPAPAADLRTASPKKIKKITRPHSVRAHILHQKGSLFYALQNQTRYHG